MSNRNSNIENIGNQYTSDKNKKKRIQKKKMKIVRRRITLFGGILLAIIIILCIMLVLQKQSNSDAAAERKHKEEQFQKKQDEEIALKEELNNLNDPDYIEKVARDDYYLSNKGEIIFRLPGDKKTSDSDSGN